MIKFQDFELFVKSMEHSPKVMGREFKLFSLKDFYTYLTGKPAWTLKRKQESKPFRRWLLSEARPFVRTITGEQWENLGIVPMCGREGFIEVFELREDKKP
jgi:prophage antirepressor-like protein